MGREFDSGRRRFVRAAATALAAGPLAAATSAMTQLGCAAQAAGRSMPSLGGATGWLNTPPLTADALLGKVVLVQFCTYTCINRLRTLPHVRAWAARYAPRGLVVLGVHTPEFEFEKDVGLVRPALAGMGIDYPITLDADHGVWNAFRNAYWPALYLVDAGGRIRHQHFGEGEGEYEESERQIQRLLAEAGAGGVGRDLVRVDARGVEVGADWGSLGSPETYLGYARAERFASPGGLARGERRVYAAPAGLRLNQWAYAGAWTVGKEAAVLQEPGGSVAYRFHARDLHLVMGAARRGDRVRFRVRVDGEPPGAAHGTDVDAAGDGVAAEPRLYQLVRQPEHVAERRFEIEFLDAGVEAFAFTFG
jgi:thiol-disulfide isomerase/thioredoxin